jgi:uncharacterized membrane protein YtjA (UPF0391 family)
MPPAPHSTSSGCAPKNKTSKLIRLSIIHGEAADSRSYPVVMRVSNFALIASTSHGGKYMLWYAWVFLVVAILAGLLGFGGIAAASAGIAKICFVIFLVLFLVSLIAGRRRTI